MPVNGTEDALAIIHAQSQEQALDDASGFDTILPQARDVTAEDIGTRTVQYIGQATQHRPGGSGSNAAIFDYSARLAGVHPQSQGAGLLTLLPGYGATDAKGSVVKSGRVAKGEQDSHEVFHAARESTTRWSFSSSNDVTVDGLVFSVPVMAGTTAILAATAYLDVRPVNSSSFVAVRACLGNEGVSGAPSTRNTGGSDSPALTVGEADQWFPVHIKHTRLIIGTEATESAGVSCFVKVKQIGGGSTGGTVWRFKEGDTFKVTADGVNLRSGANTGSGVIVQLNTGTSGDVNSGPYSGSGYRWWNVTAGGYTGYLAENFMLKTSADPPPVATTSFVRGGWLEVVRTPI